MRLWEEVDATVVGERCGAADVKDEGIFTIENCTGFGVGLFAGLKNIDAKDTSGLHNGAIDDLCGKVSTLEDVGVHFSIELFVVGIGQFVLKVIA